LGGGILGPLQRLKNLPEVGVDRDGGGPVQTGSEDDAVHVGVADVVARDGDQLVLGLGDVDVSGEPVDGESADRPRRQELHRRRRLLPAERVDDRLSAERPRAGRRRRAVVGGGRLRPVDDARHTVVVDRAATHAARRRSDERQLVDGKRKPRGNVAGDTSQLPPAVGFVRPQDDRQRQREVVRSIHYKNQVLGLEKKLERHRLIYHYCRPA